MMELEGAQRTRGLLAGIDQEERIRRDPNLRAERLVKEWNGLEAQRKELTGWENEAAREKVKGQMRELALQFKQEPQLELAVKRRAQELGLEPGSRLSRVLEEKNLERALSIAERDLGRGHGFIAVGNLTGSRDGRQGRGGAHRGGAGVRGIAGRGRGDATGHAIASRCDHEKSGPASITRKPWARLPRSSRS